MKRLIIILIFVMIGCTGDYVIEGKHFSVTKEGETFQVSPLSTIATGHPEIGERLLYLAGYREWGEKKLRKAVKQFDEDLDIPDREFGGDYWKGRNCRRCFVNEGPVVEHTMRPDPDKPGYAIRGGDYCCDS